MRALRSAGKPSWSDVSAAMLRRLAGRSPLPLFLVALIAATAPLPAAAAAVLPVAEAPAAVPLPLARPGGEELEASAEAGEAAPSAAPRPDRVEIRQRRGWVPAPPAAEAAEDLPPTEQASLTSPRPLPRPDRMSLPPPVKPDGASRAAVLRGVPLDRAALIGVMTLSSGRAALLRMPGGDVQRLAVGDMVEGWRVSAIGNDAIRLSREGEDRTFMLIGR